MTTAWEVTTALALTAAMMAALWALQRRTGNAGWVDVGWAAGTGGTAVLFAALADGDPVRRVLAGGLLAAWALRLAWHIGRRVAGEEEDARYARLRRQWGDAFQMRIFLFYQAQAVLAVLFAVPALAVAGGAAPLPAWRIAVAAAIWIVAVAGETTADRQLARHRSDPAQRGRTLRRGLWRTSRHPNYFFEWLHWWTYVALAPATAAGWATLVGPALMIVFLLAVTGVPATEAHAMASRSDYRDYQRTTSAFIPWFPRRRR